MIAQQKIFLPKGIEKYKIAVLFQCLYKQKYDMLEVLYRTEN